MGKIWNPGARRETVGEFLDAWCVPRRGGWIMTDVLFGAYEIYCRNQGRKDLTLGEFADEMEIRGYPAEPRYGTPGFKGVSLGIMEDGILRRG